MLKRFFPLLMLVLLGWAAGPVSAQEAGDVVEACGWVQTVCANSCSPAYNVCLNAPDGAPVGAITCLDQYEACMDSCYGDFWCGYRQV